jgi:ABC-2 type transport system ATP-binding protein
MENIDDKNNVVIEAKDLKKSFKTYESKLGSKGFLGSLRRRYYIKRAVKGVSFSIRKGEIVALLGENGSGKSTMIKLLTGILHPDSGSANILGYAPWDKRQEIAESIGVVLGAHNQLWWNLPAIDSFEFMRRLYGVPQDEYSKRLRYFIDLLDLKDVYKRQVRQLSLGERMKCNFMASILHMPKLVFLDEPTIGVDLPSSFALRNALLELRDKYGTTFLVATHIIEDIKIMAERVIIMDSGRKVFDGPKSAVTKMFGDKKLIEIITRDGQHGGIGPLKGIGKLLEHNNNQYRIEIDAKDIKNKTLSRFLASSDVINYNITEPDFGAILHEFYRRRAEAKGKKRTARSRRYVKPKG